MSDQVVTVKVPEGSGWSLILVIGQDVSDGDREKLIGFRLAVLEALIGELDS